MSGPLHCQQQLGLEVGWLQEQLIWPQPETTLLMNWAPMNTWATSLVGDVVLRQMDRCRGLTQTYFILVFGWGSVGWAISLSLMTQHFKNGQSLFALGVRLWCWKLRKIAKEFQHSALDQVAISRHLGLFIIIYDFLNLIYFKKILISYLLFTLF